VAEFGTRDGWNKMQRLLDRVDHLESLKHAPDCRHARRRRLQRKQRKIRWRIKQLKKDLHRKTARWLCGRNEIAMIGRLSTQDITQRGNRVFGRQMARRFYTWAHYEFRQCLIHKGKELSCKVVVVNEMLTSKTCTSCGWVNHNLGPQALNVCQQCNTVMGRDVGAGRNQFLMNLPAAKHACM